MEGPFRSVEDVFRDYRSRRTGIVKALTTDVRDFYRQCDPDFGYGFDPKPDPDVPPRTPVPVLPYRSFLIIAEGREGLLFSEDGLQSSINLLVMALYRM
ncbi:hypothetical protein EJ110_NYTH16759 [Nymphaea thermarum]|nr:hypothetical protein EJ110_NYTH16759 [Nymphaea thermarum]